MKKISIITPCFNEKGNLIDCTNKVRNIFQDYLKNYDYEHIIVDNNSDDKETIEIIEKITSNDNKVKAIINNKNYGAALSSFNAIKYCSGDATVTFLPADMQDPPELIIKFVEEWEKGYDFVVGIRKTRQEFFFTKLLRKVFYKIIKFISKKKIYDGISDFQLLDSKIVNEIKKINTPIFSRILPFDFSNNYSFINYEWKKRIRGKSNDGFFAYLDTAILGIIFVSFNPFRKIFFLGLLLILLSVIELFRNIYYYYFKDIQILFEDIFYKNILFLFLSIIIFTLGFLGEYIMYIFNSIGKNREILIKKKINFS